MPHVCFSPDEMKRRRDFYAAHPSADGKSFSLPTPIDVALPPVLCSALSFLTPERCVVGVEF